MEKLSVHDFALKSSSQMARPELTLANSFLAFAIHSNRQISCMGSVPYRCVFVDAVVCISGCRHLYFCGGGVGGGGEGGGGGGV